MRTAAAKALGQLGDARAVPPLILALDDWETSVSQNAAQALGQIGAPAIEPVLGLLGTHQRHMRKVAVQILGQIGESAVGPLLARLTAPEADLRGAAAETLDALGWIPTNTPAGAAYWAIKQKWDTCAQMGPMAVEPLLAALERSDGGDERNAILGRVQFKPNQLDSSGDLEGPSAPLDPPTAYSAFEPCLRAAESDHTSAWAGRQSSRPRSAVGRTPKWSVRHCGAGARKAR